MCEVLNVLAGRKFCTQLLRVKCMHASSEEDTLHWFMFICLQLEGSANSAAEYAQSWLRMAKEAARQGKTLREGRIPCQSLTCFVCCFNWISIAIIPTKTLLEKLINSDKCFMMSILAIKLVVH
jgi:hypothetical protein